MPEFNKFSGYTGGAATDLDSMATADLSDGDFSLVMIGTVKRWFYFDSTRTDATDVPNIVRPSDFSSAGVHVACDSDGILGAMPSGVHVEGGISGLTITVNSSDPNNDIDVSAFACFDSTGIIPIKSSSTITKRLDATWAAGTGNGGLLNGSKAINSNYFVYALLKDSDSSVDIGFLEESDDIDTYLPSGYSSYRLLSFRRTDSSGNIIGCHQVGNKLTFLKPTTNMVVSTGVGSTATRVQVENYIPQEIVKSCVLAGSSSTATSLYWMTSSTDILTGQYAHSTNYYLQSPEFTDITSIYTKAGDGTTNSHIVSLELKI